MAKQGPSSVSAEILTAHYREEKGSGMDIWKVEAEKNVVIRSQESAAFGDQADYDLQKGLAIMTGQNLRMESPDQTLTARTRFEYHVQDGRVKALGGAKITRKNINGHGDTLEADEISALLQQNEKGQRVLKTLEARGHVVITTAQEIVTGAYGIYDANLNKATLTGNVTIRRGQNLLQGEKAEVNLNTNVSRIFGGSAAGGRVRGVFYPGSEKNKGP
ncbi:MAG: ostA-like family protein [Alphaproteobacteria bacterium]|nr:ostA-like family protein [Alphaproteobacteria bacterium]